MLMWKQSLTPKLKSSLALALLFSPLASQASNPWQQAPGDGVPSKEGRPGAGQRPQGTFAIPQCEEEALRNPAYHDLARALSGLAGNGVVASLLRRHEMIVTNVGWEDPGRSHNSSSGRFMSDVTLSAVLQNARGGFEAYPQPIFRLSNFEDKTVDVDLSKVMVPVGNAWGAEKTFAVPLSEILENPSAFLSWKEPLGNLLLPRDTQVLVSAQASLMPVLKGKKAYMAPTIYNYQSTEEHPAVLTLLVTNRGVSIATVDNARDKITKAPGGGFGVSGQMLYHNTNGQKTLLTLEDLEDVLKQEGGKARIEDLASSGQEIAGQKGLNQVMLIQIPLKYPERPRRQFLGNVTLESFSVATKGGDNLRRGGGLRSMSARGVSSGVVDVAGFSMGRAIELNGKTGLVRDPDAPIRITVTYYQATDTAELTDAELNGIPTLLHGVYKAGSNLGSLVTGDDLSRVTRNYRPTQQPWWNAVVYPWIPKKYQQNPYPWFESLPGWGGPAWIYRFHDEASARRAVEDLKIYGEQ